MSQKITLSELKKLVKQVIKENKLLKEGASIGIVGLFDDEKPDLTSIINISHEIRNVLNYKFPNKKISYDDFTIDGFSHSEPTGVLNFYLNKQYKESDRDTLNKIMETIKDFCKKHKLVIGKITAETSGPKTWSDDPDNHQVVQYRKGEPLETIRVIRIPIVENNSFIPDVQHEVGWSYSSVHRIFGDILGFPIEYNQSVFTFNVDEIISKYKEFKKKFYNIENMKNEIKSDDLYRLETIYDMAVWAQKNGYKQIGGA